MRDSQDFLFRELSRSRFPNTHSILDNAIAGGAFSGAVVGLWDAQAPDEFLASAWGKLSYEPSAGAVNVETVFDLASVSKVFATTCLIARLVERGWLEWNTPVQAVLSEFRFPEIQVRHLLSHTAGFAAWAPFWEMLRAHYAPEPIYRAPVRDRQKLVRKYVFAIDPEAKPGERALYSDISFLLLGFVAEEITRLPLDRAVKKLLWTPMGVREAYYKHVTQDSRSARNPRVAATENSEWRGGVLQGQVHDDNTWAMGGYAGHAGVFAPVRELMQFARALHYDFFTPAITRAMWARVAEPAGCDRTLGWDAPSAIGSRLGTKFSRNSVGHWGFVGTSFWLDLDAGLGVSLLTNRVHPTRENAKILEVRPAFHDALRADLGR